jgi:hypothetical protein
MMTKVDCSDERFFGKTDAETIQNAIDYAESMQLGEVVIPRYNARTNGMQWDIDTCILLPSDMTILLDGCYMRMVDDVISNMFRNKNAWTKEGNTLEGEQHNIRIIGRGNAVIDGGKPSALCEQMHRDFPDKYPSMQVNLLLFLHNVRDFEVRNIRFTNSRWWATCFMYCRRGRIADLDFRMYATIENQDGIDLRIGCEYITIENITGITGDDVIALTALPNEDGFEDGLHVEGKSIDIHDVTIQNVMAASHGCGIVRFLCEEGANEYNITVDNVKDTGEAMAGTSVIVGSTDTHFANPPHQMGDFRNVVLRNIYTSAQRGISLAESMQNIHIENLFVSKFSEVGIRFSQNFECKNLTIQNVYMDAEEETFDCVFETKGELLGTVENLQIANVHAGPSKYIFRGQIHEVKHLNYEEPSVAYFTEKPAKRASAYGRYHYMAYGKVIENRPKDNRYDNTLRPRY